MNDLDCDFDVRRVLLRQLAEGVARKADELTVLMIGRGMFPSQGYKVGCEFSSDRLTQRIELFPVAPDGSRVAL